MSTYRLKEPQFHRDFNLPLIVECTADDTDIHRHQAELGDLIKDQLHTRGALLFRGFGVGGPAGFERFVSSFGFDPLSYTYRSTPRTQVVGKVYTSTEYPAKQTIILHNEMAYSNNWPMKLWFYSLKTAEQGGETPIADSKAIYNRLPAALRDKFEAKKLMYVRNYRAGMDIPWQTTFNTKDKSEVEAYCRDHGLEYQWLPNDELRTRQICQAVATHPITGDKVWFNQAHLFHNSNLEPRFRKALLSLYKVDELPRNVFFGDGTAIEDEELEQVREAFEASKVIFPWQDGDLLLVDNMLAAHGRQPYQGERKVVVAMTEPNQAA